MQCIETLESANDVKPHRVIYDFGLHSMVLSGLARDLFIGLHYFQSTSEALMPKATAYLILAHHQLEALVRLLESVKAPWAHAFVHIDRKADREPFERALCAREDCTLIARNLSVPIYWAGYSMVEATFRALRLAHQDPRRCERFSLLSGVDLPIKPLDVIADRLSGSDEIIRVDRILDPLGKTDFDRRANRVYLGDGPLLNPRSKMPLLPRLARRFEAWLPNGPYPPLPIFYGPQWWSLTREAIDAVFAFVDHQPEVMRWFKRTRCPDEMVFQTILKSSVLAENISYDLTRGDEGRESTLHGSHFVDWSRPKPDRPATLTLEHLPLLLESEALFGRKFDTRRSLDLIVALRDKLRQ